MPLHHISSISFVRTSIVVALLLVAYFLFQNVTGTTNTPILKPLGRFPSKLGLWDLAVSRSSSPEVVNLLGVDDYIDFSFVDAKGRTVNFYVGFYESVSGGSGYHSPKNCIPGGGWGIEQVQTIRINPVNMPNTSVDITKMIIRNHNEYQIVLYWYQNRGRIIASEYWEKFYLVLDALFMKRRDGAFVRLIAYAPDGDIQSTEKMLKDFAELSITELNHFLPGNN